MAFQDLVAICTLGVLVLLLVTFLFLLRAIRNPFGKMPSLPPSLLDGVDGVGGNPDFARGFAMASDRRNRHLIDAPGPAPGREILPLSSVDGRAQIQFYDEELKAWRAIASVGPDGKPLEDRGGDGVKLLRGKLYRITARPQRVAFRPERFVIGRNAADWNVHDIKIGNRSQFAQAGTIPGSAFGADATDCFVSFETAQTAMDVTIEVSYAGSDESSPFVAATIGTAAI